VLEENRVSVQGRNGREIRFFDKGPLDIKVIGQGRIQYQSRDFVKATAHSDNLARLVNDQGKRESPQKKT
jgi:hypothetical protein